MSAPATGRASYMTTTTTPNATCRSPNSRTRRPGAREFPDSNARRFNYYTPQKRKQSHYEDVTVEVQPDPRHYLEPGLAVRLLRRSRRLPA